MEGASNYWVSVDGQIVSTMKRKPILMHPISSGKYLAITYWDDCGGRHREYVHRLVLKTWDRLPGQNEEAAHLNGRRHDNRLANLRWVSPAENSYHKVLHGTLCVGESNPMSVLTDSAVVQMRQQRESGLPYHRIAKLHNISTMTAYRAVTGQSWSHIK